MAQPSSTPWYQRTWFLQLYAFLESLSQSFLVYAHIQQDLMEELADAIDKRIGQLLHFSPTSRDILHHIGLMLAPLKAVISGILLVYNIFKVGKSCSKHLSGEKKITPWKSLSLTGKIFFSAAIFGVSIAALALIHVAAILSLVGAVLGAVYSGWEIYHHHEKINLLHSEIKSIDATHLSNQLKSKQLEIEAVNYKIKFWKNQNDNGEYDHTILLLEMLEKAYNKNYKLLIDKQQHLSHLTTKQTKQEKKRWIACESSAFSALALITSILAICLPPVALLLAGCVVLGGTIYTAYKVGQWVLNQYIKTPIPKSTATQHATLSEEEKLRIRNGLEKEHRNTQQKKAHKLLEGVYNNVVTKLTTLEPTPSNNPYSLFSHSKEQKTANTITPPSPCPSAH